MELEEVSKEIDFLNSLEIKEVNDSAELVESFKKEEVGFQMESNDRPEWAEKKTVLIPFGGCMFPLQNGEKIYSWFGVSPTTKLLGDFYVVVSHYIEKNFWGEEPWEFEWEEEIKIKIVSLKGYANRILLKIVNHLIHGGFNGFLMNKEEIKEIEEAHK